MGSESDLDKYYASQESEDEEKPRPPSRQSSISQPPTPDDSASSSEDEDVGNVAGQQPQPSQWTLPHKPRRRVVHVFISAPLLERCSHGLVRATTIHACKETSPSFY